MYIDVEQVQELFDTIAGRFTKTTLLLELMSQWMVNHQKFHDTTKRTNTTFRWGIQKTSDFTALCPQFKMTGEYNFTDGMRHFAPFRMALIAPYMKTRNNRLGRFVQI